MDLFSRELDGDSIDGLSVNGEPGDDELEPTLTVSQLGSEIQGLLREAFASVWVSGELQRLQTRPNGHRYFELVEKGDGDAVVGKLDAVIWKGDFARIAPVLARSGQGLSEGIAIRCRVLVDFYPPFGRLQLHVKEIDPVFSLGELARRRAQTLRELTAAGLVELNRSRPLAELPLSIALITSHGSAAYHDFVATLRESGYGFRVALIHSAVQGVDAERGVASALAAAAALGVDCVALVRGGGSRSDLAAFDSREIATAVARCPLPVLTGLGHEIDESVADRVAFQAFKTPTKVAEFLVARIESAELALTRVTERLSRAALVPLSTARERLLAAERSALVARSALHRASTRLATLAAAIGRSARGRVATENARLDGRQRLVRELSPARTLARGFSITRRASGELVRSAAELVAGERIATTLVASTLLSRVEVE